MAMPIYEYACPACDASFETLILRKSDEAEVACPTCGSRRWPSRRARPTAARSVEASERRPVGRHVGVGLQRERPSPW
jgi:putative FmdB family regulatory protein